MKHHAPVARAAAALWEAISTARAERGAVPGRPARLRRAPSAASVYTVGDQEHVVILTPAGGIRRLATCRVDGGAGVRRWRAYGCGQRAAATTLALAADPSRHAALRAQVVRCCAFLARDASTARQAGRADRRVRRARGRGRRAGANAHRADGGHHHSPSTSRRATRGGASAAGRARRDEDGARHHLALSRAGRCASMHTRRATSCRAASRC